MYTKDGNITLYYSQTCLCGHLC